MSPSADVASSAPSSSLSMMMSDLGGSISPTPTPVADPILDKEIADVPDDEAAESPVADGAEAPAEEPQATDPHADDDDQTKPEIENLSPAKWNRVHGAYKYAKELGKAFGVVGDDGKLDLTLLPKVEDIENMQVAYSDRLAMEHDFASADPQNAQQWINNWNKFSPEGMRAVAASLPEFFAKANQEAYVKMAEPMFNRFFQSAYQGANSLPAELKDRLIDGIRMAEWYANGGMNGGQYTSDEKLTQLMSPQQAAVANPEAQELQRTKAELQQIRQQGREAQWTKFSTEFNQKSQESVVSEVDKALEPIRKFYPSDSAYGDVRESFYKVFAKAIEADPQKRQYDITVEKIAAGKAPADAEALNAQYMAIARRAIASVRGKFITARSAGIVDSSAARHQQLAKIASKVGATQPGAPRPQSIAGPATRKPGESASAFQRRDMESTMA